MKARFYEMAERMSKLLPMVFDLTYPAVSMLTGTLFAIHCLALPFGTITPFWHYPPFHSSLCCLALLPPFHSSLAIGVHPTLLVLFLCPLIHDSGFQWRQTYGFRTG